MRKQLIEELVKMFLVAIGIFMALFMVLYLLESWVPSMPGRLLRWEDPDFLVGIPASICGVGYVLTIRNPKNYTGFYGGVVMAVLLSIQFYYQGNYDLVVLYSCLFIPCLIASLVKWRKATLHPEQVEDDQQEIGFISPYLFMLTLLISALIIAGDYGLITKVINRDGWGDKVLLKLLSGAMIATSAMANFWMIYKKNDAWLCWVLYSMVGIAMYLILNNVFSLALYVVFLLVNGQAQIVWLKNTHEQSFGWAGKPDYIHSLRTKRAQAKSNNNRR